MHFDLEKAGKSWEQTRPRPPNFHLPLQSCSQLNVPFHLMSPLLQALNSGWLLHRLLVEFWVFVLFVSVLESKLRALHTLGKGYSTTEPAHSPFDFLNLRQGLMKLPRPALNL